MHIVVSILLLLAISTGYSTAQVRSLEHTGNVVSVKSYGNVKGAQVKRVYDVVRYSLRGSNVAQSVSSAVQFDVYEWVVDNQELQTLQTTENYRSWKQISSLPPGYVPGTLPRSEFRKIGSLNGIPRYVVRVSPWRINNGYIELADSIDVAFSVAPAPSRKMHNEHFQTNEIVNPWYHKDMPHVRLRTSNDGVAMVYGTDILQKNSQFLGIANNKLVLYFRGNNVPLSVLDDGNNTFSGNDTIVFQGRRAQGADSWFDEFDSTAVFMLSVVPQDSIAQRLGMISTGAQTAQSLQAVDINERFEQDTGFYFSGYSEDPAYSIYVSDKVANEGYYWNALNARAPDVGALYRHQRYVFSFVPSEIGSVTFSAHLFASNDDSKYNLDHNTGASINGADVLTVERDSAGWDSLQITLSGDNGSKAFHTLGLYAIGVPEAMNDVGYVTEVLFSHATVVGKAQPVLDSGRLRCSVPASDTPQRIDIRAANSPKLFVIDTTNQQLAVYHSNTRGIEIRSGMNKLTPRWVDVLPASGAAHLSAVIGNRSIILDSARGYVVIASTQDTLNVFETTNETELENRLRTLTSGTPYVCFGISQRPSANLIRAFQQIQATVSATQSWIVNGVVGKGARTAGSDDGPSCGIAYFQESDEQNQFSIPVIVDAMQTPRVLFIADAESVEIARVENATLIDLADTLPRNTQIISIVYDEFLPQAKHLAAHREKHDGLRTWVVPYSAVRDEYGCGQHGPYPIREFLRHTYFKMIDRPQYVVMFGSASWDARLAVKNSNVGAKRFDLVPTYGKPSSDYWFGLLDDYTDRAVPEMVVGRIPAATPQEATAIVHKIITHDTTVFEPWHRKWLYIGGGSSLDGFCYNYEIILHDLTESGILYTEAPLCFDTVTVCATTTTINPGLAVRRAIDDGIYVANFLGHGSTNSFDLKGWDPTELQPTGKFGILATYACQTNAFSTPSSICKNAEYIIEPDAGFAATIGGSGYELLIHATHMQAVLPERLANTKARRIGDIMYSAKYDFGKTSGADGVNSVMQINLLGDPTMRFKLDTVPQLYVRPSLITVRSEQGEERLSSDDSLAYVTVTIANKGLGSKDGFLARLYRTYNGVTDSVSVDIADGVCLQETFQRTFDIKNKPGVHTLRVVTDVLGVFPAPDTTDNTATISFTVSTRSLLPVEPFAYGVVNRTAPVIRVLNTASTWQSDTVHILFCTKQDITSKFFEAPTQNIQANHGVITYSGSALQTPDTTMWIATYSVSRSGVLSPILWLPVSISNSPVNGTQLRIWAEAHTAADPASISIDTSNNIVHLGSKPYNVTVTSGSSPATITFRVSETEYLRSSFYRGVNVMVLSATDTVPKALRWYDTHENPFPITVDMNGYAPELLQFLRDSILPTDRVALGICQGALSGMSAQQLADFQTIVKGLGAEFADSISDGDSYVILGSPGSAIAIAEQWKNGASVSTILQSIPFAYTKAVVTTPFVGPANTWRGITTTQNKETSTLLFGSSQTLEAEEPITLDSSAKKFPFLRIEHEILPGSTEAAFVGMPHIDFEPAAEWVVYPELGSLSDVLRADTAFIPVLVKNAHVYQPSPAGQLRTNVRLPNSQTTVLTVLTAVPALAPDEEKRILVAVPTISLPDAVEVRSRLESDTTVEIYALNNTTTQNVVIYNDTVKPSVQVFADDQEIVLRGYTTFKPLIQIILKDNSQLPISDESRLTVFVNGIKIRSAVVDTFEFLGTEALAERYGVSNQRARLTFRIPLELGQNNVTVRGSDASGNEVVYDVQLFTSNDNRFILTSVAPNPSEGAVSFSFETTTNEQSTTARASIYDMMGRLQRVVQIPVETGRTTLVWDGKTSTGTALAPGVYAYKLELRTNENVTLKYANGTIIQQR